MIVRKQAAQRPPKVSKEETRRRRKQRRKKVAQNIKQEKEEDGTEKRRRQSATVLRPDNQNQRRLLSATPSSSSSARWRLDYDYYCWRHYSRRRCLLELVCAMFVISLTILAVICSGGWRACVVSAHKQTMSFDDGDDKFRATTKLVASKAPFCGSSDGNSNGDSRSFVVAKPSFVSWLSKSDKSELKLDSQQTTRAARQQQQRRRRRRKRALSFNEQPLRRRRRALTTANCGDKPQCATSRRQQTANRNENGGGDAFGFNQSFGRRAKKQRLARQAVDAEIDAAADANRKSWSCKCDELTTTTTTTTERDVNHGGGGGSRSNGNGDFRNAFPHLRVLIKCKTVCDSPPDDAAASDSSSAFAACDGRNCSRSRTPPDTPTTTTNLQFERGGGDEGGRANSSMTTTTSDTLRRRPEKTIELAVFVDQALDNKFSGLSGGNIELRKQVLTIMSQVQHLFKYSSLSVVIKLRLKLVESIREYEKSFGVAPPNTANGDIDAYLSNFCRWQQERAASDKQRTWDHAILLSGLDLYKTSADKRENLYPVLGLAWIGGMCRENVSCTISEASNFESAFVIAHELAHSLGVQHDGHKNSCDSNKYIMSDKTGPGKVHWSRCSNEYVRDAITRGQLACLDAEDERGVDNSLLDLSKLRAPGQMHAPGEQCKFAFGARFAPLVMRSHPYNDSCRVLWCSDSKLAKAAHPALEGSACDAHGRTCREGQCVASAAEIVETVHRF